MPYVYITSFSGPPATITICDTLTNTICYTYPTQLTDLGPFPFIINLPSPDFDDVGGITLTAQSVNGCSIVDSDICSILPTPSATSGPVPCFEVIINGEFNTNFNGWSSQTADWTWSSFNGGSALYTGEDGSFELTQTGYTFLEGFNYTITYDIYSPDPDIDNGGFVYPKIGNNEPDFPSGYPYPPVSAWTPYSYVLESNGNNQLSMVGYDNGDGVYLDNVSACFTYGPCYYMEFETNNNFSVSGTVDYVDCNGVLQTYTANTEGTFYLCAIQSTGSVDIDLVDYEFLCTDAGGGTWVPPYVASPTPTPSNPPTPTPSNPSSIVLGSMYYSVNIPSGSQVKMSLTTSGGANSFVNWGDGTVETISSTTVTKTHTYSSPYNGNVVISAATSVVGKITSILNVELFSTNPTTALKLTGFTSQYGKCSNLQTISQNASTFARLTGNVIDLSGCTALTTLESAASNITGDIGYLSNTVGRITLWAKINSEPNFQNTLGGNISGLPTGAKYIDIRGFNTISGNVNSITSYAWNVPDAKLVIRGDNTISGNMSDLPNISEIIIWNNGDNDSTDTSSLYYTGTTLSGSLTLKTNQKRIIIGGANTISGGFSTTTIPNNLERLEIGGLNTISGNLNQLRLPTERFGIVGNNTVSGSLQDMIITNIAELQVFSIRQKNNGSSALVDSGTTISGNLNVFTPALQLEYLYLGGLNSVSGDLGFLNSHPDDGLTVLYIRSAFNTITANSLYQNDRKVHIRMDLRTNATGMSATQVNRCLQHMDSGSILPGATYVSIKGNHAAPTGAGITAKNSINSQGGVCTTNN
jgi:hypothetical protein